MQGTGFMTNLINKKTFNWLRHISSWKTDTDSRAEILCEKNHWEKGFYSGILYGPNQSERLQLRHYGGTWPAGVHAASINWFWCWLYRCIVTGCFFFQKNPKRGKTRCGSASWWSSLKVCTLRLLVVHSAVVSVPRVITLFHHRKVFLPKYLFRLRQTSSSEIIVPFF